ncbi:MAG: DNA primase large subunit PriL [Ferroplasma sp.]
MDFEFIENYEKINELANSLDIDDRRNVMEAFTYLEGLVKKYSENESYNRTMNKKSFAIAIWALKCINEAGLTSRFLIDQRDVFERKLMKDGKEDPENIISYCETEGLDIEMENNLFKVPFDFFIDNNKKLSGYKYRLIYQRMEHGIIYLDLEQFVHILREDFVTRIDELYNSIDEAKSEELFNKFKNRIENIKMVYLDAKAKNAVDLGNVDFNMFPPCIKTYITQMKDGQNLAHLARFTLVSFLHNAGMDNDEMISLFKTAPDFREDVTTYQVKHITGAISGTEYSPPKCATLQSNHLCYKDDDPVCDKIKHPLGYYEYKKKRSMGFKKKS